MEGRDNQKVPLSSSSISMADIADILGVDKAEKDTEKEPKPKKAAKKDYTEGKPISVSLVFSYRLPLPLRFISGRKTVQEVSRKSSEV